jgi:hypothetical protein
MGRDESVIEPFLEQLPLLFNQHYPLGVVLQRFLYLIGAGAWHVDPVGYRVFLIAEAVPIVFHEHEADPLLLLLPRLLLPLRLLSADDVGDDLLQIFIVELGLGLFLLWGWLVRVGWRWEEVSSWAWDGVDCLFHLGVDSLPSLILEDAGGSGLLALFAYFSGLFPAVGEVEVIGEVAVNGVIGLPLLPIAGKIVSFVE